MTVNPLIAATQMWCGDPEGVMAQEGAFLQAWGRVASYSLNKERLELANASGAAILVFVPGPIGALQLVRPWDVVRLK